MKKILSIIVSGVVVAVLAGGAAPAALATGTDLMNQVDAKQENTVEQKEKATDVQKKKDPAKKSYKKQGKGRLAATALNINTASKKELETLPGMGSAKAQAIIDGRPYTTKEGIMKVTGIKKGMFNKIKDSITIQ